MEKKDIENYKLICYEYGSPNPTHIMHSGVTFCDKCFKKEIEEPVIILSKFK